MTFSESSGFHILVTSYQLVSSAFFLPPCLLPIRAGFILHAIRLHPARVTPTLPLFFSGSSHCAAYRKPLTAGLLS